MNKEYNKLEKKYKHVILYGYIVTLFHARLLHHISNEFNKFFCDVKLAIVIKQSLSIITLLDNLNITDYLKLEKECQNIIAKYFNSKCEID